MPRRILPLVLIKRSSAGLGLFAGEDIQKERYILPYEGDKLTNAEADERGGRYLVAVSTRTTIDGAPRSNKARYANHSCRPNCEMLSDRGKAELYSLRKIREGEELCFDYGKEYFDEFIKPHGCKCSSCLAGNKSRY